MTEKKIYENVYNLLCSHIEDTERYNCTINYGYMTLEGEKWKNNRELIRDINIGFNSLKNGFITHKKRVSPSNSIFNLLFRENTKCSLENEQLICERE